MRKERAVTAKTGKILTRTTPQLVALKRPSQSFARMLIKVAYSRKVQNFELTRLSITATAARPPAIKAIQSSRRSKKRPKTCEKADLNRCD